MSNPNITATLSDLDRLHAATGETPLSNLVALGCDIKDGSGFIIYDEGGHTEEQAEFIAAVVNAYPVLRSHIAELEAKVRRYEDALNEIKLGEGPYNRDPLTHADNCIQAMKTLAEAALAAKETTP